MKDAGDLFLQGESNFFPISHAWRKTTNKTLPRLRDLFRLDPRTNALSIAKLLNSLFNVFSIHVVLHLRVEANLHAFHFLIREIKVPFYLRKSLYLKGKNYFIFINVTDLTGNKAGVFFYRILYYPHLINCYFSILIKIPIFIQSSRALRFSKYCNSNWSFQREFCNQFHYHCHHHYHYRHYYHYHIVIITMIIIILLSLLLSLSFYYHFLFLLSLLSSL